MKVLLLVLVVVGCASAAPRQKREAYALPDGAEILVGAIKTSFSCFADGYYADVDNNCKIFHVCHTDAIEGGAPETKQYSFLCGNQTVFNQLSLTCADPEEAVPCPSARDFFYVNDRVRVGDPKLYFLEDADIERAVPLIPALYAHALRTGGDVSGPRRG